MFGEIKDDEDLLFELELRSISKLSEKIQRISTYLTSNSCQQ